MKCIEEKSRRDETLLTVGFNLRRSNDVCALISPAGTTFCALLCRPCGTWGAFVALLIRRLKSTVNKVLFLQDISLLPKYFCKLLFFQFLIILAASCTITGIMPDELPPDDQPKEMKMRLITNKNGNVSMDITGTGKVTIDWGDGTTPQEISLSGKINQQHTYSNVNQNNKDIIITCTNITNLDCSNNQITSMDVSENTALTQLACNRNNLTSLDVSKNTNLKFLDCSENKLEGSWNLNANTLLITLMCNDNKLTGLILTGCTGLKTLNCNNNLLTSFSVSGNIALVTVDVSFNNMNGGALNTFLESLHSNDISGKTVCIKSNPGIDNCNDGKEKATKNKWNVIDS